MQAANCLARVIDKPEKAQSAITPKRKRGNASQ
ncbi:hypothetical protein ACVWXO_000331 [Bradyrhizobium sp. LM2.7]